MTIFFSGICYLTVKAGVAVRHFENSYSQGNSDDSYPYTCILYINKLGTYKIIIVRTM